MKQAGWSFLHGENRGRGFSQCPPGIHVGIRWERRDEPDHKRTTGEGRARGFTFDNEFSEVGDPGAPGGLSDAAVKVLVRPLDTVQLKGHHEAPVTQVLDRCCR